jgi:hypothetical protein
VAHSAIPPIRLDASELALLAQDASRQWTGKFNPRPLILDDYLALYGRALASHASA